MSIFDIQIDTDIGVPYDNATSYIDLKDRITAACGVILELKDVGIKLDKLTDEDQDNAARLARSYAQNPSHASDQMAVSARMAKMTPASIVYTASILDEYGRAVAHDVAAIRDLVTNKLIIETENADPRIRLKALELLGKVSDVGLFTEKSQVTVVHQTTNELKTNLRHRLEKLINPKSVEIPLEASNEIFTPSEEPETTYVG